MTDIGAVLTNDQAWSSYLHVVSAAFVIAGLFVVAVSAYKIMKKRWDDPSEPGMFRAHAAGRVPGHGDRRRAARGLRATTRRSSPRPTSR